MPYIIQEQREGIRLYLEKSIARINSVGDLCYAIYYLMLSFTKKNGRNFTSMSSAISAAQCAILEMYRREVAPYEDKKIMENGDVKIP